MRKILVLRGGALGDFIVTLPALAALRQRWPDARIEIAGHATAAQLARTRGLLNAVHSQHEARWSTLFGEAPLSPEFSRFIASFDLVLNFWPDPENELRRRFRNFPAQIFLSSSALPSVAPAAAHYCAPLRTLGVEMENFFVALRAAPCEAKRSRVSAGTASPALTRRAACDSAPIAIHPGSGSPKKNWPAENWLALLARLPHPVSLILGEAETKQWTSLPLPSGVTALLNLSLQDLVAHFASCRLFLGHDSGISHLAAACGVPSILLFGPTDPAMWAPPAPHVIVIKRGEEMASISVEHVLSALRGGTVL